MEISGSNKVALVFGATGMVGSALIRLLISNPVYAQILAFTRRPISIQHEKVKNIIIDFDKPDSYSDLIKGHDLFLCMGTTMRKAGSKDAFKKVDYDYPLQIARIAESNKVNQILLVSSVGADPDSAFFYTKVKGQLERELSGLQFWGIHLFRPSVLVGDRQESRIGEKIAGLVFSGVDKLTGGGLGKYKPIDAESVAAGMIYSANQLKGNLHIYSSDVIQKMANAYFKDN